MYRRELLTLSAGVLIGIEGCLSANSQGLNNETESREPSPTRRETNVKVEVATKNPTRTVSFEERHNQLGDTYVTQRDLALTFDDIRSVQRIEIENQTLDIYRENESNHLVMAHLIVENRADDSIKVPGFAGFMLQDGADQYLAYGARSYGTTLRDAEAVEYPDGFYIGGASILPGVKDSGWIVYDVPKTVTSFNLAWDPTAGFYSSDLDRKPVFWSVAL